MDFIRRFVLSKTLTTTWPWMLWQKSPKLAALQKSASLCQAWRSCCRQRFSFRSTSNDRTERRIRINCDEATGLQCGNTADHDVTARYVKDWWLLLYRRGGVCHCVTNQKKITWLGHYYFEDWELLVKYGDTNGIKSALLSAVETTADICLGTTDN